MATTTTISTKELQRIASTCYEGQTLKVMLCASDASGFTAESTVANWQSVELSGNGYVRFSQVIGTGAYQTSEGQYAVPVIAAAFSATGGGYTFDRIVLYIDGETYPHSVVVEDPNVVLLAGQTQTYSITLIQDD